MKILDVIAAILLVIGGLNWGLIGVFDWNLVDWIFAQTILVRIVYILVGLAAIYQIFTWKNIQRRWQ
jgi:uncharacterized protein